MKTKIEKKTCVILMMAAIAIAFAFTACDDKCSCTTGTTHEPNENCCKGTDCNCSIAEPSVKEFTTIDLFEGYVASIRDERTACGSKNLKDLGIIDYLENAFIGAFNADSTYFDSSPFGPANNKTRFRNVFERDITIIVNNPITYYVGAFTPDMKTITFHINYLQSNPIDIYQTIIDAVTFMNNPENF